MVAFALAAMTPVPLLLLGAIFGGTWIWAGFLYMAVLSLILDQLIPHVAGHGEDGQEFPGADILLAAIGVSALVLLPVAVWAIAGASGLSTGQRVLLFFGAGFWLGQVGHPAAHELIHRSNRVLFRLGRAFYGAILFGQHASAHRLVHHRFVATDQDPNSAREGESFYHFAPRAWIGSFLQGWQAEDELRERARQNALREAGANGPGKAKRQGQRKHQGLHPYLIYAIGAVISLSMGMAVAGPFGAATWVLLALHAQMQVLVSDYVQHYGLRRRLRPDGRPEPVSARHSWNTAHWFSSAMMLNAPRHSDHHMHPSRPYPALRLPDEAPRLPWPLPLACSLAFLPRTWRRAIRPHLKRWHDVEKRNP
ncbi:alkane 1-monooxygenase [Xinfangfangia sp. D13-10-4-6]|nr:alkane 1-monooxygenase [Pseudogemmobacter hezensis]